MSRLDDFDALAALALDHLQQVVAIDSASDEASPTVPSTPGQTALADYLAGFFEARGAEVFRDAHANVVASFPGVGPGADQPPVALMVHLDTAPGTAAVPALDVARGWDGQPVPYRRNDRLRVGVETYPDLTAFAGHDLVFGPGDAPFGLDDKLGLTHLMTLARLFEAEPERPRPPTLLIGRPDEEIGRPDALYGLAKMLAERGVRSGYTVDGILPFEVNVSNFNAAHASLTFPSAPIEVGAGAVRVRLCGVNTHGATAKAEGHRAATRLACEVLAAVRATVDGAGVRALAFASDVGRDCDGTLWLSAPDDAARAAIEACVRATVGPHRPRGADFDVGPRVDAAPAADGAAAAALDWIAAFLASAPGFPLLAEDADGLDGYSHPYRAVPVEGGVQVDVRIRDFEPAGLAARKAHVRGLARPGVAVELVDQYANMGPALADRPELVAWAEAAARDVGHRPRVLPIRGGTGIDPFLEVGVGVANLGTGYFAPESEKELTSLQWMVDHARWLQALLVRIAETPAAAG